MIMLQQSDTHPYFNYFNIHFNVNEERATLAEQCAAKFVTEKLLAANKHMP
jgi:hypothetical protein